MDWTCTVWPVRSGLFASSLRPVRSAVSRYRHFASSRVCSTHFACAGNAAPSQIAFAPGNAVILKGGKEAAHSNTVLVETIREALRSVDGVPEDCVQLISSREDVATLLSMGMSYPTNSVLHLGTSQGCLRWHPFLPTRRLCGPHHSARVQFTRKICSGMVLMNQGVDILAGA